MSEFNEFKPCLKSPKNRFHLSAGSNSLNSASDQWIWNDGRIETRKKKMMSHRKNIWGQKNPKKFAPVLIVPVEGQGMTNEITGVLV